MRTMNLILSSVILLGSVSASAKADPACVDCAAFEQLTVKLNNNSPDVLDEAVRRLGALATGRKTSLSQPEANALMKLVLAMLRADESEKSGEPASQLSNIWKRHPRQMEKALEELSDDDQTFVRRQRRLGENLMREGNG